MASSSSSHASSFPDKLVTKEELAKHGTKADAWIAIRGKVYDVTHYINQHPGGVGPISQWIGKDGTKAFNSTHSYVKFETILRGHEIGRFGSS